MKDPPLTIRIARVNQTDLPLPSYATGDSSGMDLCAAIAETRTLSPGETALIPTGFSVEIPRGYEGQIRPRSGLAIRNSVGIINSPGTIDADYRGEVQVILTNFGREDFTLRRGDRIAQLVIAPVARALWKESTGLGDTVRGSGGFGHTGR